MEEHARERVGGMKRNVAKCMCSIGPNLVVKHANVGSVAV